MARFYHARRKQYNPRSDYALVRRSFRRRASVPSRGNQDNVTVKYVRGWQDVLIDAGNNIFKSIRVAELELNPQYGDLINQYKAVKVLKMTCVFLPNDFMYTNPNFYSALYLTTHHSTPPTTLTQDQAIAYLSTRYDSVAKRKQFKVKWVADQSDANEAAFYFTNFPVLGQQIPDEIGGVTIYADGASLNPGNRVGTVITSWKVQLRENFG